MMDTIFKEIQDIIQDNKVVLFMKGTALAPQCGFSATVVKILNDLKVPFKDVNILANPELRQGIKDFTNWPTVPQLYVSKQFIGGCDIVKEMFASNELQELFKI